MTLLARRFDLHRRWHTLLARLEKPHVRDQILHASDCSSCRSVMASEIVASFVLAIREGLAGAGDEPKARIMVDELIAWPQKASSGGRWFGNGKPSCHLTVDGPIEALHAFAASIGMDPAWFQDHPLAPHYDLLPWRRKLALEKGAEFVSWRDQARARIAKRKGSS